MTRRAGWRTDACFIAALRRRAYLDAQDNPVMTDGVYLYMYELWRDARYTVGADDADDAAPGDGGQLTLHECTAVMLATCAALDGTAADMSTTTLDNLRTAHAKLSTALQVLGRVTPRRAPSPTPRKQPDQGKRRAPKPRPRRVR